MLKPLGIYPGVFSPRQFTFFQGCVACRIRHNNNKTWGMLETFGWLGSIDNLVFVFGVYKYKVSNPVIHPLYIKGMVWETRCKSFNSYEINVMYLFCCAHFNVLLSRFLFHKIVNLSTRTKEIKWLSKYSLGALPKWFRNTVVWSLPRLPWYIIVSIVPNMPYNALTLIPTSAPVNANPET